LSQVCNGYVQLEHVGTKDMIADGFTKLLDNVTHNQCLYHIGLCKLLLLPGPQEPPMGDNQPSTPSKKTKHNHWQLFSRVNRYTSLSEMLEKAVKSCWLHESQDKVLWLESTGNCPAHLLQSMFWLSLSTAKLLLQNFFLTFFWLPTQLLIYRLTADADWQDMKAGKFLEWCKFLHFHIYVQFAEVVCSELVRYQLVRYQPRLAHPAHS
jgi:hypothetical protein